MAWNMDKETQRGIADRADNPASNFKNEDFYFSLSMAALGAQERSQNTNRMVNLEELQTTEAGKYKYVVHTHGISMKVRKLLARFKNGNKI
jgi:hypothetical protein